MRRTDKLTQGEASFHDIEEYMPHVEEYYRKYAMRTHQKEEIVKRVYLATDDPNLLEEAQKK